MVSFRCLGSVAGLAEDSTRRPSSFDPWFVVPQLRVGSGDPVAPGAGPRRHRAGQRRGLDVRALLLAREVLLLPAGGPEVLLQETGIPRTLYRAVWLQQDRGLHLLQQPRLF